jgi:hypothetical protein
MKDVKKPGILGMPGGKTIKYILSEEGIGGIPWSKY